MKNNGVIARFVKVGLFMLAFVWLSACSVSRQAAQPLEQPVVGADAKKTGWYRISFEMVWPENQEPSWYMDTLLAHRVIAPVLERYRRDIKLWRFHRRANRDAAGHRFSFIFYATGNTAAYINSAVQNQEPLQKLWSDDRLVRVDYDDPLRNPKPNVEDTSDTHWPLIVQKTWPSFIMGASEMWLGLIREIAEQLQKDEQFDDDALYREVQGQLSRYWREDGQHPFLHHLNALFGYEEMIVVDRNGKAMRF
ncbi:MAG: hypothetical protein ACU837_12675 [Gammaproteobacteria bacterium]